MRVSLWSALTLMGCTSSVVVSPLDAGPVDGQSSDEQSSDAQLDVQFFDARRDPGIDLVDAGDDEDADASVNGPRPMDNVRHGEFDPQNVYLSGVTSVGPCGRDAMTDYVNPDVAAAGFVCGFRGAAVIATSGVLTYLNTTEGRLREFTCDDCPAWNPTDPYPDNPSNNDVILPTPGCDDDTADFAFSPDGRRMHRCRNHEAWMDPSGAQVLEGDVTVLSYGWSGFVLTNDAIIDISAGESQPTNLPAECEVLATRSGPEIGFRVAVQCDETTELWFVDHAGMAMREGVYPALPPAYLPSFGARLAGDGTLVQFAREIRESDDSIVERTIEGRSELMYTEASDPAVKIHVSSLVTGP